MAAIRKIKGPRGGSWLVQVRRKGHPTINRNFKTKVEAEQFAFDTESAMGKGVFVPASRDPSRCTLVKDIFERYRTEVAVNKVNARKEQSVVLRLMAKCDFMQMPISEVTGKDIANWRNQRLKKILPSSVNREWNTMSAVFKHAIKEWRYQIPGGNPCYDAKRPEGADRRRNSRWSDADIQAMMRATNWRADRRPQTCRDYIGWIMQIAVESAMRVGEICSIRAGDFHPDKRAIYLAHTKNGDDRWVPLSNKALSYFQFLAEGKDPREFLFPKVESFGVYFRRVRNELGLSHLTFHDTRHEATTRLSAKYPNVLELSAVTGHRELRSLKRYYNPDPLELAKKMG